MTAETIPLRFAGSGLAIRLRELTGRDEFEVQGTNTSNAINLVSSLIEGGPDEGSSIKAMDLVASDRDRVLAGVYTRAFGDRIESTLTCVKCSELFDLNLSLRQVMQVVEEKQDYDYRSLGNGQFETSTGARFRLPTGKDELELAGLSSDLIESELLRRCAEDNNWLEERASFEELLERVAPLLELELVAPCAECGHVHTIQFDMQTYLLGAIMAQRRRLLAEINRLARAYSWSLDEILSLARSNRRHLVELIENEFVT
jgi:hypothetical protein